jgi:hypothetical protein
MSTPNELDQWQQLEQARQAALQAETQSVLDLLVPEDERSKLQAAIDSYKTGQCSLGTAAEQAGVDRYVLLWALPYYGVSMPVTDEQAEAMWRASERARQNMFGDPSSAKQFDADRPISDEELLELIDLAQESLASSQDRPSRQEFLDEIILRLAA